MNIEKRSGLDRRSAHLRAAIYGLFLGRRRSPRRITDKINGYIIDYVEPRFIAFVIFPLTLSILDALFTLWLLTKGGIELNPIMKILINKNPAIFFVSKLFLTNLGILILFLFRYFKVFGRLYVIHILYSVLGLYLALIVYELYLII